MSYAVSQPVVGELASYWDVLGTGFGRFVSAHGINGLAKVTGPRLDLLAFDATRPGTGQFGRFMRDCQSWYEFIVVWWILNPDVPAMLRHFGFTDSTELDEGKPQPVMVWSHYSLDSMTHD